MGGAIDRGHTSSWSCRGRGRSVRHPSTVSAGSDPAARWSATGVGEGSWGRSAAGPAGRRGAAGGVDDPDRDGGTHLVLGTRRNPTAASTRPPARPVPSAANRATLPGAGQKAGLRQVEVQVRTPSSPPRLRTTLDGSTSAWPPGDGLGCSSAGSWVQLSRRILRHPDQQSRTRWAWSQTACRGRDRFSGA